MNNLYGADVTDVKHTDVAMRNSGDIDVAAAKVDQIDGSVDQVATATDRQAASVE